MLQGKKILLGVCGSIAAYKAAFLVRLLVKEGAEVRVVMTADAQHFITPLTLSTLSKNPVLTHYFDPKTGQWYNHVALGLWADVMLVAPASAHTLAKFAQGICDNLLCACYLSARCPVVLAPAMDLDMWAHPATQGNIQRLQSYGNTIIPPGEGELASGLHGEGRLAEPAQIVEHIMTVLQPDTAQSPTRLFEGKNILVTAGPTYESIDPVRFIGNHSTGKMGFALATYFQSQGARVTLISGPTALATPTGVARIDVCSGQEMLEACLEHFPNADITIMSAAVADYRPKTVAASKIKKDNAILSLALEKTTDILATLGEKKETHQILIGFALETDNELVHARFKLERKNLDFIVLNSLQDAGAGFATDTNKITIVRKDGTQTTFPLKSKDAAAADIAVEIGKLLTADTDI